MAIPLLKGKQVAAGTIELGNLSAAAIEALKYVRDVKDACIIAALADVADLGAVVVADIDGQAQGVTLVEGDRVFLVTQTDPIENGIYVVGVVAGTAPITRSLDANEDAEVTQGMSALIVEGDKSKSTYMLATIDPIVVDTTPLSFTEITPFPGGGPGLNTNDRDITALAVTVDGGQAFTGGVLGDPNGQVEVYVNGVQYNVGNNTTGQPFYFSNDGGTNAINANAVITGSTLHANPTEFFDLETSDRITLTYDSAS